MVKKKTQKLLAVVSVLLCFLLVVGNVPVNAVNLSQPSSVGDKVTVNFLFAFFRSEPKLSFTGIQKIFFHNKEVKVLNYSGSYVYVQDTETDEKGYIHNLLLSDKPLNIKQEYINVYTGATKEEVITVKVDNGKQFEWSLNKSGIVEITESSKNKFTVTGLKSGTVKLTVKGDGYKDTCNITCVAKWQNFETATAKSAIKVMGSPGKYYDNAKTIPEGAVMTAKGNVSGEKKYIFVTSGDIAGHIKLSDFPGIDYVMTQHHYYDQGYKLRFDDDGDKIYEYAAVLDDVMMANFNLKIYSYVNPYTSVADECKIKSYDSVKRNNLASSCPQTSGHISGSCLTTKNLRNNLKSNFGDGSGSTSKVAWTGHIMKYHESDRSNATVGMGTIIITPYARVSSDDFSNFPSSTIKEESIYTLVHETGHQFGLHDHYCANDKDDNGGVCSNKYCSDCNGEPIPYGCLMFKRQTINNSTLTKLYCDDCKEDIQNCIEDF